MNRRGGATATASHIRQQKRVSVSGSTGIEMASDNASNEVASEVKPSVSNMFCGRLGHVEEFLQTTRQPGLHTSNAYSSIPLRMVWSRSSSSSGPCCAAFVVRLRMPSQQPGESIAGFVADLRRLSEHWEIGISLEDMLRDRLVCGVRDEPLQRLLLAETVLDIKKAYKKAVAAEYATRQTAAIRGASPAASDLHRMNQAREGHKPG
ncbi:hypothetical protein MTO96_045369, partial [Rhipicephalus appendiculatus]